METKDPAPVVSYRLTEFLKSGSLWRTRLSSPVVLVHEMALLGPPEVKTCPVVPEVMGKLNE